MEPNMSEKALRLSEELLIVADPFESDEPDDLPQEDGARQSVRGLGGHQVADSEDILFESRLLVSPTPS
jgi:hypothetical protein